MRKKLPVLLIATRRPTKEVMIEKAEWQTKWLISFGKIANKTKIK